MRRAPRALPSTRAPVSIPILCDNNLDSDSLVCHAGGTLDSCARSLAGCRGGAAPNSSIPMERLMPRYTPELCDSVIDQYLHTDIPVGTIARNHAMNERDVTRIRHDAGIPPRRTRVRGLPAAMAGLAEARARLRAQSAAPPKLVSAPAQASIPATEPPA